MKNKVLAIVLCMVAAVCLLRYVRGAPLAPDETAVLVAGYSNTPSNEKVGDRIAAIFKAHHIQTDGWPATAGVSVSVPASQAKEAQRLLARAVLDEGLAIFLYAPPPQGDRAVVVSPEAVLGVPPKH